MIKIKKSSVRSFLVLCAKIAAAENEKDRELLFLTALKDGVFSAKVPIQSGGKVGTGQLNPDELATFFATRCEGLIAVVNAVSELLNNKVEFDIIIQGGTKFIRTYPGGAREMPGHVQFEVHPGKESPPNPINKSETPSPVNDDFLFIPVFFDSLEEYMKKRNLSLKQVPLKICDWCHDPFFGNRYDQRFCSKIHGQRWHAKHSYEKSK